MANKKKSAPKKLKPAYSPKPKRSRRALPLMDEVSQSPEPPTQSPSPS